MKLVFNDGTEIENGQAGYADGLLWCYFTGTIEQAAGIFFDTNKTSHIVFMYGGEQDEYTGFTVCRCLMVDTDSKVSVCLARGEQNG